MGLYSNSDSRLPPSLPSFSVRVTRWPDEGGKTARTHTRRVNSFRRAAGTEYQN